MAVADKKEVEYTYVNRKFFQTRVFLFLQGDKIDEEYENCNL